MRIEEISGVTIVQGDALESLCAFPDQSVHCCVTSPPYWGLRDYGVAGQLGLESTPAEYVEKMVAVFREVRRVLKDDGVLFLNLGDSYARDAGKGQHKPGDAGKQNYIIEKGGGRAASTSTFVTQQYKMREDLTSEEKNHVAMEMFGVRINGNEAQREGEVPRLLSPRLHQAQDEGGPAVPGERVQGILSAQQSESVVEAAGEIQAVEVGGNQEAGREVRLLRGKEIGIYDGGSRQRGRRDAQEKPSAEGRQVFINQDLQGHSQSGVPEGKISSALLQLQLRNRVLGILSTHSFEEHEIPDSARFAFARIGGLKPKDLVGIPWRVAFALRTDGWYLRQDLIWSKPNPMPESVRDRCTKSHEYLFLLAKSKRYYFDSEAIKEDSITGDPRKPYAPGQVDARGNGHDRNGGTIRARKPAGWNTGAGAHGTIHRDGRAQKVEYEEINATKRNKRSVWTIATKPFKAAHFATFPPKLIEPCILAGCPVGGIVLDPFAGAGTTGLVAQRHGRRAVLLELNPKYVDLTVDRIKAG